MGEQLAVDFFRGALHCGEAENSVVQSIIGLSFQDGGEIDVFLSWGSSGPQLLMWS